MSSNIGFYTLFHGLQLCKAKFAKKNENTKLFTKNKSTLKRKDIIEAVPGNAVEQS